MGNERPRLFDRLKKGMEDGIAHQRGEITLRVTDMAIPEPPKAYTASEVRQIRAGLNMSQPIFAMLLQVSKKTVQSWEQGTRRPQQSSARLLQFIENPEMLAAFALKK